MEQGNKQWEIHASDQKDEYVLLFATLISLMVLGGIIFTVLHIILFPYVGSTFGKGLWITLIEATLILIPSIFIYAKLIQKINQRIVKLYIFSFNENVLKIRSGTLLQIFEKPKVKNIEMERKHWKDRKHCTLSFATEDGRTYKFHIRSLSDNYAENLNQATLFNIFCYMKQWINNKI